MHPPDSQNTIHQHFMSQSGHCICSCASRALRGAALQGIRPNNSSQQQAAQYTTQGHNRSPAKAAVKTRTHAWILVRILRIIYSCWCACMSKTVAHARERVYTFHWNKSRCNYEVFSCHNAYATQSAVAQYNIFNS